MSYLDNQILSYVSVYQLLIIIHLLGLALGAGAALFSDFLFTSIMKSKKFDSTTFKHLKLVSSVVWLGLSVLILSGLLIFLGDSERLLDSSKFLAKMSIVLVLTINGIIFHFVQIPQLKRLVGKNLATSKVFKQQSASFFVGGAISGVSWVAALILGSLRFVDLSYTQIMGIYVAVVVASALLALKIRKHLLV